MGKTDVKQLVYLRDASSQKDFPFLSEFVQLTVILLCFYRFKVKLTPGTGKKGKGWSPSRFQFVSLKLMVENMSLDMLSIFCGISLMIANTGCCSASRSHVFSFL